MHSWFFQVWSRNRYVQMITANRDSEPAASIDVLFKGPVWLSNVGCSSDDEILEDCYSDGWGINNCGHYKDVGVICQPGKLKVVSPTF